MPLTVTVDHPDFPKGTEMSVMGLPLVENGSTLELTEDDERSFISAHGVTVVDAFKGSGNASVSGTAIFTGSMDDILGVDVSDTPSLDPTSENRKVAEELGFPVELVTTGGVVSDPEVIEVVETEPPAQTFIALQRENPNQMTTDEDT